MCPVFPDTAIAQTAAPADEVQSQSVKILIRSLQYASRVHEQACWTTLLLVTACVT